jgi:hypothetical protein
MVLAPSMATEVVPRDRPARPCGFLPADGRPSAHLFGYQWYQCLPAGNNSRAVPPALMTRISRAITEAASKPEENGGSELP